MDNGHGRDSVSVGVAVPMMDSCRATTQWKVERWGEYDSQFLESQLGRPPIDSDFHKYGLESYRTTEFVGNLITNAGWTRLMNLLTNQGATQALDATHARIGVGISNTAEAYTDTDLLGASKYFQLVSGAATLGTRTFSYSATFASGDANFAWNEFGLDFGTASGATVTAPLFNRKAGIAQGTKIAGQVWTATATVAFS